MLVVEVLRCGELVAWEEMMPGWDRYFGERMRGMGRWLGGKDAGATAGADSKTSGEAKTGLGAKSPPPPTQAEFERIAMEQLTELWTSYGNFSGECSNARLGL